ncbi:DUF7715 family protein [Nonomuraea rubra]
MHVLAETRHTQGQRPNDFNNCVPGELVRLASVCDRDRGDPDGMCGCARSFAGFTSAKATTTAIVIELDMTRDAYLHDLARSYRLPPGTGVDEDLVAEADQLIALAASLPLGAVIEIRGDVAEVRRVVADECD